MNNNLCRICTSKLRLNPKLVNVRGDSIITVNPSKSKYSINYALTQLKETIPNIVIKVKWENIHINILIMNKYTSIIFKLYMFFL